MVKSVNFAEPLISSIHEYDAIPTECLESIYYQENDYKNFRHDLFLEEMALEMTNSSFSSQDMYDDDDDDEDYDQDSFVGDDFYYCSTDYFHHDESPINKKNDLLLPSFHSGTSPSLRNGTAQAA